MTKNRIRNGITACRIEELKTFVSKDKKAEIYEPMERYKNIYGYLDEPLHLQAKFRYAAKVSNLPVYVHQFDGIIVFIRTDI